MWANYSGSTPWSTLPRDAEISPCGRYCYRTWRCWDLDLPTAGFIVCNLGCSDPLRYTRLVRAAMYRSMRMGMGSCILCPVFGYLSETKGMFKAAIDPIGPENWSRMESRLSSCAVVICCWGSGLIWHWSVHEAAFLRLIREWSIRLSFYGDTNRGQPRSLGSRLSLRTPLVKYLPEFPENNFAES